MSEKGDWIVCRVVDRAHISFPREPFWLGQVEFTESPENDPDAIRALERSVQEFAITAPPNKRQLIRGRVVLLDVPERDITAAADAHLTESIAAFNEHISMGFARVRLLPAGYMMNIRTGEVSPLLRPRHPELLPFPVSTFMRDPVASHPLHVLNTLFVAPDAFGELGTAFQRNLHWRELARAAADQGERLLLNWMGAETLCRATDEEEITPKLAASIAMPRGRFHLKLSLSERTTLKGLAGHREWTQRATTLFERLRKSRNAIVHSGYRRFDLSEFMNHEEQVAGTRMLGLATKSLAQMALSALDHDVRKVADMWSGYGSFFGEGGICRHAEWVIGRLNDPNHPE